MRCVQESIIGEERAPRVDHNISTEYGKWAGTPQERLARNEEVMAVRYGRGRQDRALIVAEKRNTIAQGVIGMWCSVSEGH